jgi:hypothetical protein
MIDKIKVLEILKVMLILWMDLLGLASISHTLTRLTPLEILYIQDQTSSNTLSGLALLSSCPSCSIHLALLY